MAKEIIVHVALGGAITAEVNGVSGPSCQGDLNWMEKIGSIVTEEPTEDFEREPELLREEQNRENQ